jgi:hypothetical protein
MDLLAADEGSAELGLFADCPVLAAARNATSTDEGTLRARNIRPMINEKGRRQTGTCLSVSSEVELQSELQFTRILSCDYNAAPIRLRKLRMVEEVQKIGTELKPHGLADREVLLQPEVDVCISGTDRWPLGRAVAKSKWSGCCLEAGVIP